MSSGMPSRVFFVCHHPGGANAILPVLLALKDRGGRCEGMVSRLSNNIFFSYFPDLHLMDEWVSEDSAISAIRKCKPDLVVLGTSEPEDPILGKPEAVFAFAARREKVPSVSILDFWTAYRTRFSLPGSAHLDALPDAICVMDGRAKEGLVSEGFPDELLFVTGNPHWDHLVKINRELTRLDRQVLKRRMGVAERKLILFISQPLSGLGGWHEAYDEHEVLAQLSRLVERVCKGNEVALWVKLHPREDKAVMSEAVRSSATKNIRIMDADEEVYRTGKAADLIVGMFSMLLVEYALLGLPVISFQPIGRPGDEFRLGFGIKTIIAEGDLCEILRADSAPTITRPPTAEFRATDEVLKVITRKCNNRTRL